MLHEVDGGNLLLLPSRCQVSSTESSLVVGRWLIDDPFDKAPESQSAKTCEGFAWRRERGETWYCSRLSPLLDT